MFIVSRKYKKRASAKRSALRKRHKKSNANTLNNLLKKLGKGRTRKDFLLPRYLEPIAENDRFNSLLDIYCKCFIFDVYKSLRKKEDPWYREASFFEVGEGDNTCVLIGSLKNDETLISRTKRLYPSERAIISLREVLSSLGDGNSECNTCSLQKYLKNHNAELAEELPKKYRRRRICEKCKAYVNLKTINSPSLFFKGNSILLAKGRTVRLAEAVASMKEERDSEVLAQLILLYHRSTVEVAFHCELTEYSLHYGGCSFDAGEIDVLTLKDNTLTQIEITKMPYKEPNIRDWSRHQQKAYNRHFMLKGLGDFSVKTFFLFPFIGENDKKIKIKARKQVRKQFSFYPIFISFDFNKDVEEAKEKMKKLIKAI